MKIIVFVDNLYDGGGGRVASILSNALSDEYEVYCVTKESGIRYPLKDCVQYYTLDVHFKFLKLEILLRLFSYIRLIRKIRPDLIISLGYVSKYTTLAKILTGHGHFKTINSERSDPYLVPSSIFMRWIRDCCYAKADVLVCQTDRVKQYFRKRIKIKTIVIPNPITPDLPYWNGIDSFDIVAACRLDGQKNLPMLIDAFGQLHEFFPQYRLHIYGEGPLEYRLKKMISDRHLHGCVELKKFTTHLHEILSHSFMFVSSSDHEGLSNSMLEALAIGIPTVCTDIPTGGASMFIKDKQNGMLTPVKDSTKFFYAMKYLIEHKELLSGISNCAIKIRNVLAVQKIINIWMKTINEI